MTQVSTINGGKPVGNDGDTDIVNSAPKEAFVGARRWRETALGDRPEGVRDV